jgi:hypothetical protein
MAQPTIPTEQRIAELLGKKRMAKIEHLSIPVTSFLSPTAEGCIKFAVDTVAPWMDDNDDMHYATPVDFGYATRTEKINHLKSWIDNLRDGTYELQLRNE